jgi:hypothetical protein
VTVDITKKFTLQSNSFGHLMKQNLGYQVLTNVPSSKHAVCNLTSPMSRLPILRERSKMGRYGEKSKQTAKML